ncbi:hypothetical protein VV208B2_34190 [Vibrio vulnificus]|nr:hypothetical protein VV208B2_34190 [Vibrio vulnificus]
MEVSEQKIIYDVAITEFSYKQLSCVSYKNRQGVLLIKRESKHDSRKSIDYRLTTPLRKSALLIGQRDD